MDVGAVWNSHLCQFIALPTLTYASVRLWPHYKATIDTAGGLVGNRKALSHSDALTPACALSDSQQVRKVWPIAGHSPPGAPVWGLWHLLGFHHRGSIKPGRARHPLGWTHKTSQTWWTSKASEAKMDAWWPPGCVCVCWGGGVFVLQWKSISSSADKPVCFYRDGKKKKDKGAIRTLSNTPTPIRRAYVVLWHVTCPCGGKQQT